ncbi:hypothetical protein T03_11257 [Trichinella britovi]|uniref:Uncharacterized protein n=1 Tax=Trichinella britovi TaxID=45882 RepID=A0A0V1AJA8_TRIBR|nr:hypothetical protein T03_11257 [Trichinella britovi]
MSFLGRGLRSRYVNDSKGYLAFPKSEQELLASQLLTIDKRHMCSQSFRYSHPFSATKSGVDPISPLTPPTFSQ